MFSHSFTSSLSVSSSCKVLAVPKYLTQRELETGLEKSRIFACKLFNISFSPNANSLRLSTEVSGKLEEDSQQMDDGSGRVYSNFIDT